MRIIRIALSVVALFLIVAALAAVTLRVLVNPNQLQPVIAQEIKKQTGYDVVIDGGFTWSFYPRFGIKANHITLTIPQHANAFLDMHGITFVTPLADLLKAKQQVEGDIFIDSLQLLKLQAQHVHVGLSWQDNVVVLQPLIAQFYSGTLHGTARGQTLASTPVWEWDVQLQNVQLRPLLVDVNGAESKLKLVGLGNISLKGTMQGNTREQLLDNFNGAATFNLQHGVVEGIDINYLIKSASALINKQPVIAKTETEQTAFDNFSGTATINKGIISSQDVNLTASTFSASGAGSINLPYDAINFQLRVTPQNSPTHWAIPVMITGDLLRPDARFDATELNILVAKQQLEDVKIKIRDQIKQRISGKTGALLQNMLGS